MASNVKVFVVDDDEAIRDSLEALLGTAGFDVQTFSSAGAFLDQVRPDQVGCLLTDVRMPDMDGLELQVQVARSKARISVIMMTGHGDVPMAVRAMKAGAVDFIEKSLGEAAVLAAVRRALQQLDENQRVASERDAEIEKVHSLSMRERQVLAGLVAGNPNKAIASRLQISPRTVEIYRSRLMEKMQARNLPELVRMAITAGIHDE